MKPEVRVMVPPQGADRGGFGNLSEAFKIDALVSALNEKRIRGAAVDVIEGEPDVPDAVLSTQSLIITPHIAANSPESRTASVDNIIADLKAHFAGEPVKARSRSTPARRSAPRRCTAK